MAGRELASKLLKTAALLSDSRVAGYIPRTREYSAAGLSAMLGRYGNVVIKPVVGGGGYGVIKVFRDHRGMASRICRAHVSMETLLPCARHWTDSR